MKGHSKVLERPFFMAFRMKTITCLIFQKSNFADLLMSNSKFVWGWWYNICVYNSSDQNIGNYEIYNS